MAKRLLKLYMRKIISSLLTLCMIAFICPAYALTSQDNESPDLWAKDAVDYMKSYQIIPEALLSFFSNSIRRDEFTAILMSTYNEACQNYQTFSNQKQPFSDTQDSPYFDYIKKAYIMEIIRGNTETTFCPQDFITREDIATIISRFIKLVYPDETLKLEINIADKEDISSYALDAVQFCSSNKIMNGTGNGFFSPKVFLTRQEAMVIMYNICQRYQVIKNGRESAVSTLSNVNSGLHEMIDENYLYIRIQDYPFSFNGSVENKKGYKLIRTPLVADQKNQGEILLTWDRIDAYTISKDKIYFCDKNSVYSMDKNGQNLKMIRSLTSLIRSSDIANIQVEGSWIFIGVDNSILKLRTDGTCISFLAKGVGSDFKSCGKYLYSATTDPLAINYSIVIKRTSITGDTSETLYSYKNDIGIWCSFYPHADNVYLWLNNYENVKHNTKIIMIDGNKKSFKFIENVEASNNLESFGGNIYITNTTGNQMNMRNITGGTDLQVVLPAGAKGNIAFMYDKYIIFSYINHTQHYTRYYYIYNLETKTLSDIYGNNV